MTREVSKPSSSPSAPGPSLRLVSGQGEGSGDIRPQGRIPGKQRGPIIRSEFFFWAAVILAPLGAVLAIIGAILS